MITCKKGNEAMVKYLVELGAYVNQESRVHYDIKTPISEACKKGNLKIIQYLIDKAEFF